MEIREVCFWNSRCRTGRLLNRECLRRIPTNALRSRNRYAGGESRFDGGLHSRRVCPVVRVRARTGRKRSRYHRLLGKVWPGGARGAQYAATARTSAAVEAPVLEGMAGKATGRSRGGRQGKASRHERDVMS